MYKSDKKWLLNPRLPQLKVSFVKRANFPYVLLSNAHGHQVRLVAAQVVILLFFWLNGRSKAETRS